MYVQRPLASPWLACAWVAIDTAPGERRILPDGRSDLVWTGSRLVVAGPDTAPAVDACEPGRVRIGVGFRPGGAPAALGVAASELRDRRVALSAVWGRAGAELEERVAAGAEPLSLLLDALDARLRDARVPDGAVATSVARLAADPGVRVAAVARDVALSERQLRRRFHEAVGYGPRTFGRVARLRRLLRLAERPDGDGLAALAAAAGYADQAHMTRECRALTGLTPGALLG